MKLPIATVAVFLASFTVAQAEQNCGDLTNQADMNICAGKAYKASDAELNKVYRKIQARLKDDADTAKLLVSTQKAWIGFRDAECKFSSSGVEGGSVYPFISASCLDAMTKSRIEDLKVYLDCEEGDMSCPVPAAD